MATIVHDRDWRSQAKATDRQAPEEGVKSMRTITKVGLLGLVLLALLACQLIPGQECRRRTGRHKLGVELAWRRRAPAGHDRNPSVWRRRCRIRVGRL